MIVTVTKQNVLCLIGALLRAAEMDDVRLIHDLGFGCEEVLLKSYRPDLIDTGLRLRNPRPRIVPQLSASAAIVKGSVTEPAPRGT